MHFVTYLVIKRWGLNVLQSANHMDHPCTFHTSLRLNMLKSANHINHLCTFKTIETKFKILVNYNTFLAGPTLRISVPCSSSKKCAFRP
ncbi:hypothetical protein Hanom_Chr13g01233861 [Helianthus anomalus]